MKYKIVEKTHFDDYSGKEESKFYIKRKTIYGNWIYSNENDTFELIMKNVLSILIPAIPFLILVPFFHWLGILNIFTLLIAYISPFILIRHIINIVSKKSYYSLSSAQEGLKKILKKKEFKNKTFDVVEITTTDTQIIVEKNKLLN